MAHVGGNLNDLRAKLGNDVAIKAYWDGTLPFPDGTIIARLAWRQVTSARFGGRIGERSGSNRSI